jgi:serine phosphatase RsbU (regulator of sigma subunit)
MLPDCTHEVGHLRLETDSILVAYMDGVTDVTNTAGVEWGEEALTEAIRRHSGRATGLVADQILRSAGRFGAGSAQDDRTLLVIRKL